MPQPLFNMQLEATMEDGTDVKFESGFDFLKIKLDRKGHTFEADLEVSEIKILISMLKTILAHDEIE